MTTVSVSEGSTGGRGRASGGFAPPLLLEPSHMVQFYEEDEVLADTIAHYVGEGLAQQVPVLVIATATHREALVRRLQERGVDVGRAASTDQLVVLDADEALAKLMVDRTPDRSRFVAVVGNTIDEMARNRPGTQVRVFGDMVDLLCKNGNTEAALRLEALWSELAHRYGFTLLCAYDMAHFRRPDDLEQVRNAHGLVLPIQRRSARDERDTAAPRVDVGDRIRALESEIEYRRQLENELRRSKRELEDFSENAPIGIHRISGDGTILWANKAELELFGYSREEYFGHHLSEFSLDHPLLVSVMDRLNADETVRDYEMRIRCKDGTVKVVAITSNVYREDGKFVHTRCFMRDVTERRRAETSLRFLADAGEVIASSLDYELTLTRVARRCVPTVADWAFVDLKSDDRIKRLAIAHENPVKVEAASSLWTRFPVQPQDGGALPRSLRTGEPEVSLERAEQAIVGANADREGLDAARALGLRASISVPLIVGKEPVGAITLATAESGRPFGVRDIELVQELSRRASTAIAHARLYNEAQTATRLKDEFLATVSHELRTPLNAILGWARMLRTGTISPEKMGRALEAIERNSLSQVQLIEDLLDVSRIISGKLRLDVQPISLDQVVDAAVESVQPALEAKHIRLHHYVDPEAGPVSGDAHRIQQVIWNLLSNAVKFTPKGGSVRLTVERAESGVELRVSDTGQGIPKHLLGAVFDRFKQADGSAARVHGGLGLGLAIVRHIVELHGGTVEAYSEGEGRGATFVARLPISSGHRANGGLFRQPSTLGTSLPFEPPKELQGLSILVIDDEQSTRDLLTEVLEQCGCAVLVASSAREGLAILDRASPRIIVCDIGMPGVDGYEFIENVRRRSSKTGGRIVAVALTAYASAEDRRRALRAGYQMHIAKPVEPAELVATLANLAQIAIAMP